jgi:hypothetical protein
MIRSVINGHNLRKACQKVVSNKGSAGIDGVPVQELSGYLDLPGETILFAIDGHPNRMNTPGRGNWLNLRRKGTRSFRLL